ncbi:MAG: glycosyltransferase [Chitinophagales bacterium]|nr:glycosyltransferase [Chitinophagales bacterium]
MAIRILFIGSHRPGRSPSQRFRMEHYFPYLSEKGFEYEYSTFISETGDISLYRSGNYLKKLGLLLSGASRRLKDILRANNYDIIFIQREAFLTGTTFFENLFQKSGAKIIFDFDDSIWIPETSNANRKFAWLKDERKTSRNIKLADLVIAGNYYLATYAKRFNDHVIIIPTTVDTDMFQPSPLEGKNNEPVCIGWSGSLTTIEHFKTCIPALKELKARYGNRIHFKVMGDENFSDRELNIQGTAWSEETEMAELNSYHIGIMPLPDNEWTRGKCGLKGLLYMSLAIPPVMSPVGVNCEIIQHGKNGFLAADQNEWVDTISRLIENPEMRTQMGMEARKTVVEKYSVASQLSSLIHAFNDIIHK